MLRIFFLVFTFIAVLSGNLSAQGDRPLVDYIIVRFGSMQIKPHYGDLNLDYIDNAVKPHHIFQAFSLADFPPMYGVELGCVGVRTRKSWYIEGFNFGYYRGGHADFFHIHSGVGYEVMLNKKLSLTPTISAGYGDFTYFLGDYEMPTNGYYLHVHKKNVRGDFSVSLRHTSMYAVPKIALRYSITEVLNLQLTAGYRTDLASYERISFTEKFFSQSVNRSARASVHEALQQDGQYISGKCLSLSGLTLSMAVLLHFD